MHLNTAERYWLADLDARAQNASVRYKEALTRILLDRGEDINKEWTFCKNDNGEVVSYNETNTVVNDADKDSSHPSYNREDSS